MVPNSLGPGELLLHYGTDEQKRHYLPRLAKGIEIPCFALTNPHAGSDAAAIPDFGIVCMGRARGQARAGLERSPGTSATSRSGPVATLLGLAFRAYDPDHLARRQGGSRHHLRADSDARIRASTSAVATCRSTRCSRTARTGARTSSSRSTGSSAARPMLGNGWRMLMECLAAGRGISLPSSSTGMAKLAVRATGGYARVRTQFKTPIGKFEGIEEALARMGGNLYMMDATRMLTALAVDLGEKPAVPSAIAKYHLTERARAGRSTTRWTSPAARASAWARRISSARRTCSCRCRSRSRAPTS